MFVTPGQTYYLDITCGDYDMWIDGHHPDPYPGGHCYANNYTPYTSHDLAFRTWAVETTVDLYVLGVPGTVMSSQINGATPSGPVAYAYAFGTGVHGVFNIFTAEYVYFDLSSVGFGTTQLFTANVAGAYLETRMIPPRARAGRGSVHQYG